MVVDKNKGQMNEGRFWKVAEKKNLVTYLGEITKKLKCMLNVVVYM